MNDFEKKISGIADLANLLYASYAGRDLFAKVIPGFVAIVSTVWLLGGPSMTLSEMKDIPLMAWILVFGVFYAAGFTIQRLGETFPYPKCCIIKLYADGLNSKTYGEKVEEFFRKAPSMYHRAQRERYVVIKELYGNLAVALMIVLLELLVTPTRTIMKSGWPPTGWSSIELKVYAGVVVLVLSIIGLLFGNRKLCESEINWISKTIAKPG